MFNHHQNLGTHSGGLLMMVDIIIIVGKELLGLLFNYWIIHRINHGRGAAENFQQHN